MCFRAGTSQCESTGSRFSGSGPEFSRCHDCGYGRGAGIISFHSGVIGAESAMAVLSHMGWRQQELEEMRSAAKQRFRQSRSGSCVYCGSLIKCDMYRHVARLHLDLAQLWRCPVSWCTIWKGTPQDCMDHLRGTHDVPWEVKTICLEKLLPPWTVPRKVWTAQHSGISTDVLLFSDIHLSLVHHYIISVVFLTSLSGRTICRNCVRCCRCP